jgi:two-component system sensor histidine kinase ChiS
MKLPDMVRPTAAAPPPDLRTAIPRDLPDALADPQRFDQVLTNLLANAVKFTEHGSVSVSAHALAGEVVISVSDTGIGIARDAQGYVFDEFRQEDASTTRQYGGTGLGLAIAKKLVELQGGRIWVESAPGAGSTFSFALPSAPDVPSAPPERAATRA